MSENLYNEYIIENQSMAANYTSPSRDLSRTDSYSIQVVISSGSPVGEFKLQASLDDVNWNDISDSITSVNGTGNIMYVEPDADYDKLRAVYTRTSGSGTMSIKINGKGDFR